MGGGAFGSTIEFGPFLFSSFLSPKMPVEFVFLFLVVVSGTVTVPLVLVALPVVVFDFLARKKGEVVVASALVGHELAHKFRLLLVPGLVGPAISLLVVLVQLVDPG